MNHLTNTESHVWQIIQDNMAHIGQLSISEVADLAHVSLSTVNRTVRKKGFDGYAAFRHVTHAQNPPKLAGFSNEVLGAIAKNQEELLKTIDNISAREIESAVEMIHGAQEILIFSRGLSTNVADELMKKLQLFHKPVSLHEDAKYMAYYAQFLGANSLIIALSLSGETKEILDALKIAKPHAPKVLSITVNANTSLTQLSDVSLIGYKSHLEVNYFDLDVHSRLPLSILSRVLIDAYSIYTKTLG